MEFYLSLKIIVLYILLGVIILVISIFFWMRYPFGVKQFETVKLGMDAAEKAGDSTVWAPPDDKVFEESEFFVYSLGNESMCTQSDCGMGGYFIECLGGWISGYKNIDNVDDYGLYDAGVNIDKQKIITIADKNAKIVGIYPGASIKNLPYIMRNHREIVSKEVFEECSSLLPSLWK